MTRESPAGPIFERLGVRHVINGYRWRTDLGGMGVRFSYLTRRSAKPVAMANMWRRTKYGSGSA